MVDALWRLARLLHEVQPQFFFDGGKFAKNVSPSRGKGLDAEEGRRFELALE